MSQRPDPKTLLIAGIILSLALWKLAAVYVSKPIAEAAPEAPVTVATAPVASSVPQARSRALYTAPREATVVKPSLAVAPACLSFWEKLRGMDLDKNFTFPPNPEKPIPVPGDCGTVPKDLSAAHQMFAQACHPMINLSASQQPQWQAAVAGCQVATLLYRAKITDWMTRDIPLNAIADNKVLADKLMARFGDDPAGAAEVAERLLEKDPEMYVAAKASALGRFMDAQASATGKETDPKWTKAMDSISRLEKARGGEPAQQLEIKILSIQRQNPDPHAFRDEAIKASERHPDLWVGPYYAAWGENSLGNKPKAVEWLDDCLRKLPGDKYCQKAKENLAKGEVYSFQSHLTFSLNPLIE